MPLTANVENGFHRGFMVSCQLEIMKQCDNLDGLVDGIISEPEGCVMHLNNLVCRNGATETCLSPVKSILP